MAFLPPRCLRRHGLIRIAPVHDGDPSGIGWAGGMNSRCIKASIDKTKTHAGIPVCDTISTRFSEHAISPIGTPSRTCWSGDGTVSALVTDMATDMTPDSATAASTRASMIIFSIENGCVDEYLGDLGLEFCSITQKTAHPHHTPWKKHAMTNLWRLWSGTADTPQGIF